MGLIQSNDTIVFRDVTVGDQLETGETGYGKNPVKSRTIPAY
jgi:hypothetical protein